MIVLDYWLRSFADFACRWMDPVQARVMKYHTMRLQQNFFCLLQITPHWELGMNDFRYVQYGCGWSAPRGWRNFDASPTLRFERLPLIGRLYTRNASRFPENIEYGEIVKGLPVSSGSCNGVYCSHILEHLSLDDYDCIAEDENHTATGRDI